MNNKTCKKSRRAAKKKISVHVSPKVDDKPLHFNALAYFKGFDLQRDALRVKEIDRENIILLKKINVIYRLGVSIVISHTV